MSRPPKISCQRGITARDGARRGRSIIEQRPDADVAPAPTREKRDLLSTLSTKDSAQGADWKWPPDFGPEYSQKFSASLMSLYVTGLLLSPYLENLNLVSRPSSRHVVGAPATEQLLILHCTVPLTRFLEDARHPLTSASIFHPATNALIPPQSYEEKFGEWVSRPA